MNQIKYMFNLINNIIKYFNFFYIVKSISCLVFLVKIASVYLSIKNKKSINPFIEKTLLDPFSIF